MGSSDTSAAQRVLVTDAQELAGLGAVRSLGRAGFEVLGGYNAVSGSPPVASSRFIRTLIAAPDPWLQFREYCRWLLRICQEQRIRVLLPISEASVVAARTVRDELPEGCVCVLPDDRSLRIALSKYEATREAQRLGVAVPRTWYLCDGMAIDEAECRSVEFPCIVKSDNVLVGGQQYLKGRNWSVRSSDELAAVLDECLSVGARAIAQQRVPGRGVGAFFFRRDGQLHLPMCHQRIHEVPYTGGWSSLRGVLFDDVVRQAGEKLLTGAGYEGLAMVEFRHVPGQPPVFLEINGRLWGSLALSLHAGYDYPAVAVRAAIGQPLGAQSRSPKPVRCAQLYPGEAEYLLSILRAKQSGLQKLRLILHAFFGVAGAQIDPRVKSDFFWWSDPLPGLSQAWRATADVLRKLSGALTARLKRHQQSAPLESFSVGRFGGELRRILVLCSGNICRSPLAEHVIRSELLRLGVSDVQVSSAGLLTAGGEQPPARFLRLMQRAGFDGHAHRSSATDAQSVDAADLIVVMDRNHARLVLRLREDAAAKIVLLGSMLNAGSPEILDPYVLEPRQAAEAFTQVVSAGTELARWVQGRMAGNTTSRTA